MINFFEKKGNKSSNNNAYSKIAALLIYAAKIDEVYEDKEIDIIKQTLLELGAKNSEIEGIIKNAITIEENSNQILDFTREIKNIDTSNKIKIIESLWKIIYSNDIADIYETNLMRRIAGLLYIDAKTMADLKEKVKNKLIK